MVTGFHREVKVMGSIYFRLQRGMERREYFGF